jgi:hypothetical protein
MGRKRGMMLRFYYIYMHRKGDNKQLYPYLGEIEETEKMDYGGGGFYVHNHNERNVIAFGDVAQKPYQMEGTRNLASHIHRILLRLRENRLDDIDEIRILIREE